MKLLYECAVLIVVSGCATSPMIAKYSFNSGGVATMYEDGTASYLGPGLSARSTWKKLDSGEYKVTWPNATRETRCYPSGREC